MDKSSRKPLGEVDLVAVCFYKFDLMVYFLFRFLVPGVVFQRKICLFGTGYQSLERVQPVSGEKLDGPEGLGGGRGAEECFQWREAVSLVL